MKILTKEQLGRVRQLAMAADALVSQAETIVRNAHRSWHLRFHLRWAQNNLLSVISEPKFGSDYYDPPRTRKVERMERMERERKEKRMKRVTMGGSSKGQGPGGQLPSGTVPDGGERTQKVKE
jgi:hypothetical protein